MSTFDPYSSHDKKFACLLVSSLMLAHAQNSTFHFRLQRLSTSALREYRLHRREARHERSPSQDILSSDPSPRVRRRLRSPDRRRSCPRHLRQCRRSIRRRARHLDPDICEVPTIDSHALSVVHDEGSVAEEREGAWLRGEVVVGVDDLEGG